MASTVLTPIRISRYGGSVLKGCRFGFEELLEGDDTLVEAEITTNVSGLSAANIAIVTVAVEIGGVDFLANQTITYDLLATSIATLGDGEVRIRATSAAGMELEWYKDVIVYERLPSR